MIGKLLHKYRRWIGRLALLGIILMVATTGISYLRLRKSRFGEGARDLIERSRRILDQARPDYQDDVLSTLPLNSKNGGYFRFDDNLKSAIVVRRPEVNNVGEKLETLYSMEFSDPKNVRLKTANSKEDAWVRDGTLRYTHDERNYLTNKAPLHIAKEAVGEIVIRARVNDGTRMRLAWQKEGEEGHIWQDKIDIDIIPDSKYHSYVINAKNVLKRGLKSHENIDRIYLKPSNQNGAKVEIDYIRFISKTAKYARQMNGVDTETLDKELRQVLYMLLPQTIEYTVTVPKESPMLEFGTGILLEEAPVEFKIFLIKGNREINLYNETVIHGDSWHDARISLDEWKGEIVKLSFRVTGDKDNVVFWSNPWITSRPENPFNVIIILEDALRADHLSMQGYSLLTSPNKDIWAKKSVVFDSAFSQATKTRPSVPSLMTSLLPTCTGVWNFADLLAEEYLTLSEVMRNQGYETASFIQNGNAGPYAGLHQGFSQLFDEETIGAETQTLFGETLHKWIEKNKDHNFFLYLHIQDPHGWYNPPQPYDKWYREANGGKTPVKRHPFLDPEWVKEPTVEGRRLRYDGEVAHNDVQIKQFLSLLEHYGLIENTLLIFIADHGEHLGEHGQWEHHPPGFLQVIHVPFMMHYPTGPKYRGRIGAPVQLLDVMPTILELAGVETSNIVMQGDSLVDLIEGKRSSYWERRLIVSEEPVIMSKENPEICGSLIFQDWHLIGSESFWPRPLTAVFKMRVFDYKADHGENSLDKLFLGDWYVRYKFGRIIGELQRNNMRSWRKWTQGNNETYKMDPETLERLRSLGYAR